MGVHTCWVWESAHRRGDAMHRNGSAGHPHSWCSDVVAGSTVVLWHGCAVARWGFDMMLQPNGLHGHGGAAAWRCCGTVGNGHVVTCHGGAAARCRAGMMSAHGHCGATTLGTVVQRHCVCARARWYTGTVVHRHDGAPARWCSGTVDGRWDGVMIMHRRCISTGVPSQAGTGMRGHRGAVRCLPRVP
jgi:hypothetical protein